MKAQVSSILTILYNCVQKRESLQVFLSTHTLGDSLVPMALVPNLEIRFLSKLVLISFLLILTPEQCGALKLQPDEVSFFLVSLMKVFYHSSDDQGFSTGELLQGLLNLTAVEENALICFNPAFLKCFEAFLSSPSQLYQHLILEIIWNLLSKNTSEAQIKAMIPVVASLAAVSFEMKTIYCCISFLLHQGEVGE